MKLVRELKLSEGQTAFELNKFPGIVWTRDFNAWVKKCGIEEYVKIEKFYIAEMFGDIDYPAIQFKKGTPEHIKTLVILTWL